MKVAFIGPRHSGKTTASNYVFRLWLEHLPRGGRPQLAFADPLKDAYVKAFNAFEKAVGQEPRFTHTELYENKDLHRRQLEDFGTKFGRERFGDDLWINLMEERIKKWDFKRRPLLMIDDCRFLNEAELLRKYDFTLVRIYREPLSRGRSILKTRGITEPTIDQIMDVLEEPMPSEVEIGKIACDHTIINDGTEKFYEELKASCAWDAR